MFRYHIILINWPSSRWNIRCIITVLLTPVIRTPFRHPPIHLSNPAFWHWTRNLPVGTTRCSTKNGALILYPAHNLNENKLCNGGCVRLSVVMTLNQNSSGRHYTVFNKKRSTYLYPTHNLNENKLCNGGCVRLSVFMSNRQISFQFDKYFPPLKITERFCFYLVSNNR